LLFFEQEKFLPLITTHLIFDTYKGSFLNVRSNKIALVFN